MLNYGFFNSVNGDRKYNADDLSNFFLRVITNGVFDDPADTFKVSPGGGMTVSVAPGWGAIKSKYVHNDSNRSLTVDEADVSLGRIDRVILRYNRDARNISLFISKGTPSSTPLPPPINQGSQYFDLSLAQISVAAGATQITAANIVDERSDSTVCGHVKSLIDGKAYDMLHGLSFQKLTQAEYDAITTPDENTVYIIVAGEE